MTQLTSPGIAPLKEMHVFWRSDGEFAPSLITDLSRTGAFIRTSRPAQIDAVLHVRLDAPGREICAQAIVRRVVPGQGMAVEFDSMTDADRAHLDAWVKRIEAAQAQVSQDPRPVTPAPTAAQAPAAAPSSASNAASSAPPSSAPSPKPSSAASPAQNPAPSSKPAAAPGAKTSSATSPKPSPKPVAAPSAKPAEGAADPAPAPPRNRGIDRRVRFRHKFIAPVKLTVTGSAQSVQAQLLDLGTGGCYVKVENPFPVGTSLDICITENEQSFEARANVVSTQPGKGMGLAFTAIDPTQLIVLDGWLATSMERRWLASNRRRSQRVMVSIPVHVSAKNTVGAQVVEQTKTVSVSPHGALLRLETTVIKGQTILLRDPSTNEALECSVVYLGNMQDGRREVGVSFVQPNRSLWRIAFPPADWSPQHPDAKG
jgi:hypothetical protein